MIDRKSTVSEIFAEAQKAFKRDEVAKREKMKQRAWTIAAGVLAGVGALACASLVALIPAWATLWSTNRLALTAYELNLGNVFATSWIMSLAGFALWRFKK